MEIKGFKAFKQGMINSCGVKFYPGKRYIVSGKLQFGPNGNGIHFCKYLEDTLRYVDGMHNPIEICSVRSYGDIVEYDDDYYGYYNLYVANKLLIEKKYSREEIIQYFLKINDYRVGRFLKGYRLTDQEIKLFQLAYKNKPFILDIISYYQEENLNTYNNKIKRLY